LRAFREKTSDYSAIPLCSKHHRQNADSYHLLVESRFAAEHGMDLQELVLALIERFRQLRAECVKGSVMVLRDDRVVA